MENVVEQPIKVDAGDADITAPVDLKRKRRRRKRNELAKQPNDELNDFAPRNKHLSTLSSEHGSDKEDEGDAVDSNSAVSLKLPQPCSSGSTSEMPASVSRVQPWTCAACKLELPTAQRLDFAFT